MRHKLNRDARVVQPLRGHVTTMRTAHHANDVGRFVDADLAFHDVILQASGNVFVAVLFAPLSQVLSARRAQTSKVEKIQIHAIHEHAQILEAPASADPEQARLAMDSHMAQTMNDLKTCVLHI